MNSINKEQQEDNFKNLYGSAAAAKIKELAEKAGTCFFCTSMNKDKPFDTRPMSVQAVDDNGNFWFLSADDSHQNEEILRDPAVQLLFQGSSYSDFLSVYGIAIISRDHEKIKEFWKPILKTWFTEGIDDPRITVIQVKPSEGWERDTKNNAVVGFAKRIAGAIVGKTMDDSIEGKLKP